MSTVQFSEAEINMLKMHYLQEYNTTIKKLEELNTILKKLGVSSGVSSPAASFGTYDNLADGSTVESSESSSGEAGRTAGGMIIPRKKFRKMSWAKFVKLALTEIGSPMSAPELLEAGRDQFNITDDNRTKSMQALQATLFRLSKKSDVLGSEKQKGSYIGYFLK